MDNTKVLFKAESVSKQYSGVRVLNSVEFDIREGEIHALVGENGAGKSTLAKIISGVVKPEEGKLYLRGDEVSFKNTAESFQQGISIIHQEFNLIPSLTIHQNIFLGKEKISFGLIREKELIKKTKQVLATVGLHISATEYVKNLSVAQQQLVEIAKSIAFDSQICIMDEPTAPLTEKEIENLFSIISQLKNKGAGIVYVSHRLNEVFQIADRITVFRDGEKIGTFNKDALNEEQLINHMVGRDLGDYFSHTSEFSTQKVVLRVEKLSNKKIENINLKLYEGEILGIAGLVGSGRTELLRAIYGIDPIHSGTIDLFGERLMKPTIRKMKKRRVGFIPEDRKKEGILLNLSLKENICLTIIDRLIKFLFVRQREEIKETGRMIGKLNIKCNDVWQRLSRLSGGNQQKAVLAKWIVSNSKILFLDEPTRGIDVGAKHEIYMLMSQLAKEGVSIIMVSSELPEIIGMSDRVYVMADGRITGELCEDIESERIMKFATQFTQKKSDI